MEINAVAYYKYHLGDPGWENLQLVVKFRYGKRIIRRKLVYVVASMNRVENPELFPDEVYPYKTKDEYYFYINSILGNPDYKTEKAEEMIKNWIDDHKEVIGRDNELKNILKRVKDDGKTEIKVKIK